MPTSGVGALRAADHASVPWTLAGAPRLSLSTGLPGPSHLPHVHPPGPSPVLTVLLLQDQDHICLLQCDLVRLLGQVGLGDLHLEQVWQGGQASGAGLFQGGGGLQSQHTPCGLVSVGPRGPQVSQHTVTWQLPSG